MAFEFKLSDDEIREKMFDFIKPVYKRRWDPAVDCINWIYGVYDSESGIFITYVNGEEDNNRYILITRDGNVYYIMANRKTHIIFELSEKFTEYSELIQDGIYLYENDREKNRFNNSFSEEQEKRICEIKELMADRCKSTIVITNYEDAEKLFYQEEFDYNDIISKYNKNTVAKFNEYMSDERMREIRGEQYRGILSQIVTYGEKLGEEETESVLGLFKDARVLSIRGIDDIYAEITFEAIKKGYEYEMTNTLGYVDFIKFYMRSCLKDFPDKIKELCLILDFINEYMGDKKNRSFEFYKQQLEKLIFQKPEGFLFVLTTEELREKMFHFLEDSSESYWLKAKNINWTRGVYNKESGIFLTQVGHSGDGLCDEMRDAYIVMLDNGEVFQFLHRYDAYKSKNRLKIPKPFEELNERIREGMAFYENDWEYSCTLSKEKEEELKEIQKRMEDRWQQIVSRNREKRASERANVSKKTKKHNKKKNTVISVICNIFDFMDGLNCEFEKKSWILLLIGICSIIIEIILLQYIL